jgi:hypothetical protein
MAILSRLCRRLFVVFAVLYLLALLLLALGTFGLMGVERDPLSGVFLVLLGIPWAQCSSGLPEPLWPWAGALAPGLNLLLLCAWCRWRSCS